MKQWISIEELKEFEAWKAWRNGGLRLETCKESHNPVIECVQTWEDIEEDYLKEEYPVFGGPFTDALTPFEWLKIHFNSPKRR
jgi:hypothetical protein